jgi:hypothetical protein
MLLAKYEQRNLMAKTLAQITGQSIETIQAKLKDQRMRGVMQELNIDRQAFRSAMQAKVIERVKQAAVSGTISPEQETEILTQIENHSKRQELMSQLIEKGIEDGTITQEQAQTLMRKPR